MAATNRPTKVLQIAGLGIEVYTDVNPPVATLSGVKTFFGTPPLGSREIIALKKDDQGVVITDGSSDWDKLSAGIGNGTLTYA